MSHRCLDCGVAYPISEEACGICGTRLVADPNKAPDPGWQSSVADAKIAAVQGEDPVIRWRFGQLLRAGQPPRQAEEMARIRTLDLHKACDLTRRAGPALAQEILL